MGKRLQTVANHVTDITISTATVDIQVMRIGTKQMTLAVFRQLPVKDIFDEYSDLIAAPWGWVNYDRVSSGKPFVFSYDGVLYRSTVDLEREDLLIVKAEVEEKVEPGHYADLDPGAAWKPGCGAWVSEKKSLVPTGKWVIKSKKGHYYDDRYMVFDCENFARAHYAARMDSVATLKEAPQLFIGV